MAHLLRLSFFFVVSTSVAGLRYVQASLLYVTLHQYDMLMSAKVLSGHLNLESSLWSIKP